MGNKVIKMGDATIEAEIIQNFNAEAMRVLSEIEALKEEYKDLINAAKDKTGLKKNVLSGFFKARFSLKTKETVEKGEMFEALNEALDNVF